MADPDKRVVLRQRVDVVAVVIDSRISGQFDFSYSNATFTAVLLEDARLTGSQPRG